MLGEPLHDTPIPILFCLLWAGARLSMMATPLAISFLSPRVAAFVVAVD